MNLREFAKMGGYVININKIKFIHYYPDLCEICIMFDGCSEFDTFYNISNTDYKDFEKMVMNNYKIELKE